MYMYVDFAHELSISSVENFSASIYGIIKQSCVAKGISGVNPNRCILRIYGVATFSFSMMNCYYLCGVSLHPGA